MKIPRFILKPMLIKAGVPKDKVDEILDLVDKDPELFQRIAEEIKAKMDSGVTQERASQEIMTKYGPEIAKIKESK